MGEIKNLREIFGKFRDIALMILEMDTAYRFVMQDILPEFDINNLKHNPIKELKRVFSILLKREHADGSPIGDQNRKWQRVEKMVVFALRISHKLRKFFVRFISEIDMEKIKLDEADWYFVLGHHCYNSQDISYEDRLLERERIDREKGHKIPRLVLVKEPNYHLEVAGLGL